MPNPDRESRRIVFVVGLHRSGTTLLTDLISRHDDVSAFDVKDVFMNEGQYLQTVMRNSNGETLDGIASLGLRKRYHLTENSPLATDQNADRLWNEWKDHWDPSKACLIEKSPGNLVKTRFLRFCFPSARFVLITRHPVAQAMAISKWATNRSRLQFLANWVAAHDTFTRDTCDMDVHHVSYETLCAAPELTMSAIFDHIGLNRSDVIDRPIRNTNGTYFDAWTRLAIDRRFGIEATLAKAVFGRSTRRWNYRLSAPWLI